MKHLAWTTLAIPTALLLAPSDARAAGFALDTQSARAVGMATAVTALVNDPSAIYFNPAGIAQGKILDAEADGQLIFATSEFTSKTTGVETTTPFRVAPPFSGYVTGGITKNFSIGVGMFTPFGLSVGWPAGWEGRSIITFANLTTYNINPTVAYRLGSLRIGAGVQIMPASVKLERDIRLPNGLIGSTQLGATAVGVGGNVGIQVEAIPRILTFGLTYRSTVVENFEGDAHFEGIPPEIAETLHDQTATTRVVLPDSVAFGFAWRPIRNLVFDLDGVYFGWEYFRSIDIHFPNDTTGTLLSSNAKRWNSTVNAHFGAEVTLDEWRIRGGFMYDPTPQPEETLGPDIPDTNRLNFSVGAGYHNKRSGLRVDLGYMFVLSLTRTSTLPQLPGDYEGFASVVSLGVGWATPHPPDDTP